MMAAHGAPTPEVNIEAGRHAVINDSELVTRIESTINIAGVPSMFSFIGVTDPKLVAESKLPGGKPVPTNHSPFFAPMPEPSIITGVTAMSLAVMTVLGP